MMNRAKGRAVTMYCKYIKIGEHMYTYRQGKSQREKCKVGECRLVV